MPLVDNMARFPALTRFYTPPPQEVMTEGNVPMSPNLGQLNIPAREMDALMNAVPSLKALTGVEKIGVPLVGALFAGPKALGFEKALGKFSNLFDKKPRFEIDDSLAVFMGGNKNSLEKIWKNYKNPSGSAEFNLGDIFYHPELYKNYPDIGKITVEVRKTKNGEMFFDPNLNKIVVPPETSPQDIVHEIQHAIQEKEGFAKGGLPKSYSSKDYGNYKNLAGEIEARDVSFRSMYSPGEKQVVGPYQTENIPLSQWGGSRGGPSKYVNLEDRLKNQPLYESPIRELASPIYGGDKDALAKVKYLADKGVPYDDVGHDLINQMYEPALEKFRQTGNEADFYEGMSKIEEIAKTIKGYWNK